MPIPPPADAHGDDVETTGRDIRDDVDPELAERPTVRRKKVSLTDPAPTTETDAEAAEHADDARVYVAPPPDGLGKFDLGSVPASVTPPRTWRKAAWFATLSSGAVVIALLFAGSVLVGQPPQQPQQAALEDWPDRHGGAPMLPGEGYAGDQASRPGETSETDNAPSGTPSADGEAGNVSVGLRSTESSHTASTGSSSSGESTSTTTTSAEPSSEPSKPPVTPAPTETAEPAHLFTAYDADTLAQRSQDYLNTVTEDAEAAYELTTGELAAEGPDGLRERYAEIAYVEVRHVYIDQNKGYTLNEIDVTYTDGTKEQQTRKLVFETNEKISSDDG
ncbi:hypothetical protein FHU38_004479 [Saccharomonospora amisosensis]|uniref:Uncharacterized protein n=1 Tax=Saccharomonospora amisosensis TaxID=1128677 RepID=A0A7X5UU08_9PSEU|nr:hypothetical protein [Saccharomonospora amisosensis]NIJ14135.1 hypothetical protein [Saccharomonospora amisosensis]